MLRQIFQSQLLPIAVWVGLLCSTPAGAGQTDSCMAYAEKAEKMFAIPPYMLQAVIMTESGGNPNALNLDGQPLFPDTAVEAAKVLGARLPNVRNADVGCGQISLRYHPEYFRNRPSLALDPWFNVVYASKYLIDNKKKFGNWTKAVAYYHSDDPSRQKEYVCKVVKHYVKLAKIADNEPSGC